MMHVIKLFFIRTSKFWVDASSYMSSFGMNWFEFVFTLYLKYLASGEAQLGGSGANPSGSNLAP